MTTSRQLRQKYLRFFEGKGHTVYPSGSLVPVDVTGKLDESLLFNGAGMVQFKPFFRGIAQPPNKRLTTAQKCVRTGDIEEVGNLTHLTFFEMLGNFSFGDYFKGEAIDFSWEFLTSPEWLGLDPERLSFTVYEEDDEALARWSDHFASVGIDAAQRVFRLGEETNYWPAGSFSAGPPGPCGPNSEMFYWVPSESRPPKTYSRDEWLADDAAKNWLEIWNDVFIQFEWRGSLRNPERPSDGYEKEGLDNLPFRSVDTGMGLERTIGALNGVRSVYATDCFAPILEKLQAMGADQEDPAHAPTDQARAMRLIADHIRTACFCIADGVIPGSTGRGYVLRRLIRRAVLKGQRLLGFDKAFFHEVFEGVAEAMGDHYTELTERRDTIVETLRSEEAQFRRTLASGSAMLQNELELLGAAGPGATKVLGGTAAFRLYDTFGFPLEVVQEICAESGVEVDTDGYETAMAEAQERSRGSAGMETVYGGHSESLIAAASPNATTTTPFVGAAYLDIETEIVQISPRFGSDGRTTGDFQVSLGASPFYAESGGQVGDTGWVQGEHFRMEVRDTWKEVGLIWSDVTITDSSTPLVGLSEEEITEILQKGFFFVPVRAAVDAMRRRDIIRNHSATHLLHAALRRVLGTHVTQAGSLVSPDHLRFDFTHGKGLSDRERIAVEDLVNEKILESLPVDIFVDVPLDEAKKMGAMALFGEKYGSSVRVVRMADYSLELCGGCHVAQTSEIGMFLLTHEASAAGGVRRIEALTGAAAHRHVREQDQRLGSAASLLKTAQAEVVPAIERLLDSLKEERRRREKAEAALVSGKSGERAGADSIQEVGGMRLWTSRFDDMDSKIVASAIDDAVAADPLLVALGAIVSDGKVSFVCKVGSEALKAGGHAGNLVREVAKIAGGGGGGRPDFATAGGRDLSKVDAALAAASQLLAG